MKKATSKKVSLFDSLRVITLDESQCTIYKSGHIDVISPDNKLLTAACDVSDNKVELIHREMAIGNFI